MAEFYIIVIIMAVCTIIGAVLGNLIQTEDILWQKMKLWNPRWKPLKRTM